MERTPRLSDNAFWLIAGNLLQTISTFLLLVVLVRILPKDQFGQFQWVVLVLSTVASLSTLGIPQSYLYFIPRFKREDHYAFLNQGLMAQGVICLVVGIGAVVTDLLAPQLFGIRRTPSFLIALLLFPISNVVANSLSPIMLSIGQPRYSAFVLTAMGVLYLGLAILAASISHLASDVFVASTMAYGLAATWGIFLLLGAVTRGEKKLAGKQVLWEQIRYSLPLWASSIAGDMNRRIDGFIVRAFFSASVFASFFVGAREIPFVGIFAYGITQAILPRISKLGLEGDHLQQIKLWHHAMLKTAIVIMPVFLFLFLLAGKFMQILFTRAYSDATPVFMIYLLLLPLRLTGYGAVLSAMGKPQVVFKGAILGIIVNLALGLALVRLVGWTGPAIGAVTSQLAMILYFVTMIQKTSGVAWSEVLPAARLAAVFFTALVPLPIAWLASQLFPTPLTGFLAAGVFFFTSYFALAWHFCVLSDDDKTLIRRWLRLRFSS